jgi:hypothetical protein
MAIVKEATEMLKVRPGQKRHATPRVVASALPRTVIFSQPRRRVVKPGAGSPRAVLQQEVIISETGKKAVGPWMGPFAAASEDVVPAGTYTLIPNTILMDNRGHCHLSLDASEDKRMVQELYKAQSDSGLLSEAADEAAAKVSDQRLQVQREKQQQARAAQAHSLLAHAALDKTPPAKNIVRKMHIINQPRRFN